jgi:O-antigen/teichoic acid export membrane protein
MRAIDVHVLRAALASMWSYSSRVVGLGWTALLIGKLGIGDYGKYSIAVAAAALVNAAIDNAFYVRSLRIEPDRFERERCARVIFGVLVGAAGVLCFLEWYIAGFAIIVAAGELLFNTFKSQYLRSGRPDIAMRFDAVRQLTSIGLGAGGIVFLGAGLHIATWLYVAPYALILAVCLRYVRGRRPAAPGGIREISLLSVEAFAAAVYAQGDLLVIGATSGDRMAGYYSVALVTALAISMIGQNYANTFIETLRGVNGHLTSAPPLAHVTRVAAVTGAAMASVGIGVLISGRADLVGVVALIMSVWVFARSINHMFIVLLFLQHRDVLRVRATVVVAVIKMSVLLPAVHLFGIIGAAVSCVLCEVGLLLWYHHVIYRRPSEHNNQEAAHS